MFCVVVFFSFELNAACINDTFPPQLKFLNLSRFVMLNAP